MLERRVARRVGYVWQGVVRQELIGLGKLRPFRIQVLLEFRLGLSELHIFVLSFQVLQILHDVRVLSVHHEVNLEIKLKLFILKIPLFHVYRNERIK